MVIIRIKSVHQNNHILFQEEEGNIHRKDQNIKAKNLADITKTSKNKTKWR